MRSVVKFFFPNIDTWEEIVFLIATLLLIGILLFLYAPYITSIINRIIQHRRYAPVTAAVELDESVHPSAPCYDHVYVPPVYAIKSGTQPKIIVHIKGSPVAALVDSGSAITCCRKSLVTKLNLPTTPLSTTATARAVNDTTFNFLGQASAEVSFQDIKQKIDMLVSEDNHCPAELLIGTDTLRNVCSRGYSVNFDLHSNTLTIGEQQFPFVFNLDFDPKNPLTSKIVLRDEIQLPPRSDTFIIAKALNPLPQNQNAVIEDAITSSDMIKVGTTLVRFRKMDKIPLRILNAGFAPAMLRKDQTVATLTCLPTPQPYPVMFVQTPKLHVPPELDYIETLPPREKTKSEPIEPDLTESILSEDAKKHLTRLVRRYKDVFVGNDGKIGKYTGPIKHEIELIDPKDIPRRRPYRVPLPLRAEIEQQLKQLLDQRIIEKSHSPFASPIVMVKKKDGSYRLCVDYRQLNQNTVKRVQLLPNIQEILDLTAGHKYFSTLDCSQAFHQVLLAPDSIEKTAFITHMGLFQYLRMPFGLTAAPSTMQRIMDHMKAELTAKIFIYLDDLCVSSTHEDDHLRDLEEVFQALRAKGLKLSLKKCFFGRAEVKYLGFLLSENGIRPDPKNVETVSKFQIPKTLTELRSFIGAVSYFRRFIEGFATIMAPLYELTKQGESIPSRWGEAQTKSFNTVIEALKKAPTLAPPRQDRPYIIETDASAWGLAATLLQKNEHGFLFD